MLASEDQVAALVKLFKGGTKLTYKKGEYVIRPGEAPSHIYYIEKGLVKAFNITKYGEENLLIIRKNDEIFPLIWSITGQERHVIYQALNSTVLWRIEPEAFQTFLLDPQRTLAPLLDMVTEMYRIHSERIFNLQYRSVRERIVSFLLMMAGRFGKQTAKGMVIEVPLRHQDIASSINATRETTSRQIAVLERQGLISNHQTFITLKDVPAMRKLL
jgi:CRP/FNR family transcriptional regulator